MPQLKELFSILEPLMETAPVSGQFRAVPIPPHERHRLAVSPRGSPVLLLAAEGVDSLPTATPVALEHLTVQYGAECHIVHLDRTTESGIFTILQCNSNEAALRAAFLNIADILLLWLGSTPSATDIGQAVGTLIELFRAMTLPPQKSVQGLWAELFLIAQAQHPPTLVRAWHRLPSDRYDFGIEGDRIEAKSTSGVARQHHFTREQLLPPPGTRLLIASMFVEPVGIGTSIHTLLDEVRPSLIAEPTLLLHLERTARLTLGREWQHGYTEPFDRLRAKNSLLFFEPYSIPQLTSPVPAGVSDVRFVSNLSAATPMSPVKQRAAGGLWGAALQQRRR